MLDQEPGYDHPFLKQMNHEDLVALLPYMQEEGHTAGSVLLARGERSGCFHLILSGTVEIRLQHAPNMSSAKRDRGQFIGEWSCLTGEPSDADYKAEQEVRTLSVSRTGMLILIERCPSFRDQLFPLMLQRLSARQEGTTNGPVGSPVVGGQLEEMRELRLGPLLGSSSMMQTLKQQIAELAASDEPVCITGEKGVGKFHIASELHYRSGRSAGPLLRVAADSYHPQAWERIVRAAVGGTILIEQSDLFPTALLHRLLQSAEQSRVILTGQSMPHIKARPIQVAPLRHRPDDIPELVYAWLGKSGIPAPEEAISEEALRMLLLYPYPDDNIDGLHRILNDALARSEGRRIQSMHLRFQRVREPGTRPKIGLALGSGSVRGAAHVGILKVLEEEQIPIDFIAGSSVGALDIQVNTFKSSTAFIREGVRTTRERVTAIKRKIYSAMLEDV